MNPKKNGKETEDAEVGQLHRMKAALKFLSKLGSFFGGKPFLILHAARSFWGTGVPNKCILEGKTLQIPLKITIALHSFIPLTWGHYNSMTPDMSMISMSRKPSPPLPVDHHQKNPR